MELTWLGKAEARGVEKGLEQGMQKGIERGMVKGIAQGVEQMRRVVLRLLTQRFGPVPTKVRRKIEAIDSLEPLADLAERVLVVSAIDDLDLQ